MATIENPVLRGFNPDPSILRVGEDYYIATSTFEWWPGVQIHHSRDLVNWRLIGQALNRPSQLNLLGNACSGGIWAPCLSRCDGLFYLCYTDVKNWTGRFKDHHNYVVTSPSIEGPWSDPVYLNSSGFDPSLFHDDDGRKWLVNMLWDHRRGKNAFGGILLQEYDAKKQKLVGPVENIFLGTKIGKTEGPHLYKRNGWYYLLVAEGGTEFGHAASVARSKKINGPYEADPKNPILTSADAPKIKLQKAGHASLVDTPSGQWYLAHLVGRPLGQERRCILGRETAIQQVEWSSDGWLRLAGGGHNPLDRVPAPEIKPHPFPAPAARDDFDAKTLSPVFQTLRQPPDGSWLDLASRPGWLRLRGQESLESRHRQSIVARRAQSFRCEATTCLEFEPENFQEMAGLIAIYNLSNYYYLRVSHDERLGKTLALLENDAGAPKEALEEEVSIAGWKQVYLRARLDFEKLQFSYSADGNEWTSIGPALDATHLSDEYSPPLGFTGAFLGICAQDLRNQKKWADFGWFEYREF